MTELGGSLTIQNDNTDLHPFSVGFHKSGTNIKISKTSGQSFGRVFIKTPFMFKGYLRNSEKQITLDSEGYFDTGDIEKSRDFYERAIQINPFNPFVHMRLIAIYQKLGWNKEKELQAKLFGYIDQ